ncbi:hypothetical protein [Nocardia sp. CY41]|uniref:hypothetical protein n=1 Tax=Nocardia sp. CY41 TaxID=2608686 RepID=UPI0013578887|nr:hypothetical protein [Nocardia sp. CY41]
MTEIAELAPQLAEHDEQLKRRRSDLDRRRSYLLNDGEPVPEQLIDEQRQVRKELAALTAQREQLLSELAGLRAASGLSQRLARVRSRNSARKHGLARTREEYESIVAQVRNEQGIFDRTRNWLDGTTVRAKAEGAAMAAIHASCGDPMSFDSNDW